MRFFKLIILFSLMSIFFSGCDRNGDFVLFSIEKDKQLGEQMREQIANDPAYNVLDRTKYAEAYEFIQAMTDNILNSGQVTHKDVFDWRVNIIRDDNTLNAFATPGGQIYVYTGLINYLDKSDDLAGVMGHEIAHADQRHSVKQMQKNATTAALMEVVLGEKSQSAIGQLLANLLALKYSRKHETESDNFSVKYLSGTKYACNGAATFFQKLNSEGDGAGLPEFLSTHPNPDNRVENITNKAKEASCNTTPSSDADTEYIAFRRSLVEKN